VPATVTAIRRTSLIRSFTLAHETRLEVFRQSARKGGRGESAGELARTLGIPRISGRRGGAASR
jgi:hypothetical protein